MPSEARLERICDHSFSVKKTFLSPTITTRSSRLLPDLIFNVLPIKDMGDAGSRALGS